MTYFALFDPLYWMLMAPAIVLSLWATARTKGTFKKYAAVGCRSGMSGADAARAVLAAGGVEGVSVEQVGGFLSDHYDPRSKTLRLSPDVFGGRSVSALGVAAHEAGHAIQDARGYTPLHIRSQMVPIVQIGSNMAMPMIFIGLIFAMDPLMKIGIVCFALMALFSLVTLPVEFNASSRAVAILSQTGITSSPEEDQGVRRVLNAAALTYVAAAATAIMQLIYLILRSQGRD